MPPAHGSAETPEPQAVGRVQLVGAGPGDPKLLTLRGLEALSQADLVMYDYLASELLLEHAPPQAEKICLGRHGHGKIWKQPEINERMIAEAQAGKTVVRLKGGDPSVFGRLAEELRACQEANVPVEVVPGVTTAMAAGAYAGVTLTDRSASSCVALVTGHECAGKNAEDSLDFRRLATFPGTLVVYMGVTTAPVWSRQLIDGGMAEDTPALIVRKCSAPDQSTLSTSLGELGTVLAPGAIRPPLVVILGSVAQSNALSDWFVSRPLFGKTVLVTRPREQAGPMVDRLRELGAQVLLQPTIEITEPTDWTPVDRAIDSLNQYDLVTFSSRNGVRYFLERLESRGGDARRFGAAKIAAIGPATAQALTEWKLHADVVPTEYRAEALAEMLSAGAAGKRMLLLRANRGREVLGESLREAGAMVDEVVVYESHDLEAAEPEVVEALQSGSVDWVTATSPSIARATARLFGDRSAWPNAKIVAISPLTAEALGEAGMSAKAIAETATADGVIDAVLKAEGAE